jgi:hypothetical protein
MTASIRLTTTDIKTIIMAFSGSWERYRSPYGVVRAAEAHDDFEITAEEGTLKGSKGDFLCVAEDTYDCWVDDPHAFHRMHTHVPRKETK